MAYVISKEDSWAELLSQELTLTSPSRLHFHILQTRYDFGTKIPQVQLFLSSASGSQTELIYSEKYAVKWTKVEVEIPAVHQKRVKI